jgi:hypothetical protein
VIKSHLKKETVMDAKKEQFKKSYHQPQVRDYGNVKALTHGGPGDQLKDSHHDHHKHS